MPRAATASKSVRSRTQPRTSKSRTDQSFLHKYLEDSHQPLTILLFVLPLLILHELGVRNFGSDGLLEYRVTAFSLLNHFFNSFGVTVRYLPPLAVIAILLAIHAARGERWVFNARWTPVMAVEGLLWALPLVGVYFAFAPAAPTHIASGNWKLLACLYLGAGVYEELVFRLAAIALLSVVFIDLLRIRPALATPAIVLVSATAFSVYHILGSTALPWQAFVFIGLRGIFYAIIFIERGFGISIATHTSYDLLVLAT